MTPENDIRVMAPEDDILVRAREACDRRDAHRAETLYRKILATSPDSIRALRGLEGALRLQGRLGEANLVRDQANRIDAGHLIGAAQGLLKIGRVETALKAIRRALELDPTNDEALCALGDICRSEGDFSSAIEAYSGVPKDSPLRPGATYLCDILSGRPPREVPSEEIPRPAPVHMIRDFLTGAECDALMAFTLSKRGGFDAARIRNGDYEPEARLSWMTDDTEAVQAWFLPKVKRLLPLVLKKLGLEPFEPKHFEVQITAHNERNFYKVHRDTGESDEEQTSIRIVTFVYYFFKIPRKFSGGDLLLHSDVKDGLYAVSQFTRITPRNNSIVFFPSRCWHQVTPVHCETREFQDGRFTVNGWVLSAAGAGQ